METPILPDEDFKTLHRDFRRWFSDFEELLALENGCVNRLKSLLSRFDLLAEITTGKLADGENELRETQESMHKLINNGLLLQMESRKAREYHSHALRLEKEFRVVRSELKSKADECSQMELSLRTAQDELAHRDRMAQLRPKPVMRNQLSQTVKPEPVTAPTQVKLARDDTAMCTVRPELLRQQPAALECATSAPSCTSSNSRRSFAVSTKQPRCKFKCSSRHDTASCDRYPVGQLTQRKFLTNLKMNNRSFFDTLVSSTTRSPEQFHASTLKHFRQSDRRAVPLCHQCQHKGHWTSECSKVNIGKMTMARWLEFLCQNNECFYEKLKIKQKLNNFYLTCLRYTFQ